jgi:hypothetical protein
MTGPADGIRQLVSDLKAITAHTRDPTVIVARVSPLVRDRLWGQLPATGCTQAEVRSDELLPGKPQHPASGHVIYTAARNWGPVRQAFRERALLDQLQVLARQLGCPAVVAQRARLLPRGTRPALAPRSARVPRAHPTSRTARRRSFDVTPLTGRPVMLVKGDRTDVATGVTAYTRPSCDGSGLPPREMLLRALRPGAAVPLSRCTAS